MDDRYIGLKITSCQMITFYVVAVFVAKKDKLKINILLQVNPLFYGYLLRLALLPFT